MTTGIMNSINIKGRMYKLLLKTDPLTDRYMTLNARFKTYRETLRRSINETKKMYFQKVFGLYRNDIKINWLTIKETLQRNQKHDLLVEFLMDNRRLTNPDEIANEFNAYFQGRQTRQNSGGVGEVTQYSGLFLKGSTF